jgi:peptide/nickel transport system ATP-binding protein
MTLLGLESPTEGTIYYKGRDVSEFSRKDWKKFRRNVQIIFQDPFNALDPKMTVRETLREPLKIHGISGRDSRIRKTLRNVELEPVENYLDRTPQQLSGGEKQRVSIARALVVDPDVIMADEPVSMLDVSTQAAVLRTFANLIDEFDVALLYISHDLSTVSYVCQEISVMYLGRIVESAPTEALLSEPQHPYSKALINAIPIPDPHHDRARTQIQGSPQEPVGLGEGCRFRDRCPERMEICEQTPAMVEIDSERQAACHLYYDHETSDAEGGAR